MSKATEPKIDLVVSFDTTGSMYPVLSVVRNNVVKFVNEMFSNVPNLEIGIIAHGDYCDKDDPYTIRIMDLTRNKEAICDFIRETDRTYGGDADECYELVLNSVRKHITWRAGSTKILLMIGDAAPHSKDYYMNEDHLDWYEEAGLLGDMGVKIFAVHALSYYRDKSTKFYEAIARVTEGKYLTLDQFNEVSDLIMASCISQYSETKLDEFVSIIQERGRFTKTLARNLKTLGNKSYGYDICSDSAYGMTAVPPGRFQVMHVDEDCDIKSFVTKNGTTFKRGRGFYELTKHETIQQYKEVIIQDRDTGEMFTGPQVREKLGLSPQTDKGGVHESLSSRDTMEFRVFVQSTSVNRKLIGGTAFLYEVSDIEDAGSEVVATVPTVKASRADKVSKVDKVDKADKAKKTTDTKKTKTTKTKKAGTSGSVSTASTTDAGAYELPPIPDDSDILKPSKETKKSKDTKVKSDDKVKKIVSAFEEFVKAIGLSDEQIDEVFELLASRSTHSKK